MARRQARPKSQKIYNILFCVIFQIKEYNLRKTEYLGRFCV